MLFYCLNAQRRLELNKYNLMQEKKQASHLYTVVLRNKAVMKLNLTNHKSQILSDEMFI